MRRAGWGSVGLLIVLLSACGGHTSSRHQALVAPATAQAPTTAPTTTTTAASLRDQVIAAHKAYEASYSACAMHPASCDMSAVVVPGSPAAAGVTSFMAGLAKDGLRGRPSPQTYYVYETFTPANTSTQAVLRICSVDANVTYKPSSGPQGQDVIVNDRVDSDLGDWTFRLDGGGWKAYAAVVISDWKGSNGCPPRPAA
ncbi:MAG: hypothetical protein NVS9B11_20230 [Candidatus Dormibacteraceae bacterium]